MRAIIIAAAIVAASLMTPGSSSAQYRSQADRYNYCAQLASQQGLSPKSASGRRFVSRCMQQRGTSGSSRNCPDDPRARSAYPSWMCP